MTDNNPIVLCIAAEQLSLAVRGLVLQSEGYRVVSASNFEDAMRFGAALDLWHKGDLHSGENEPPPEPPDAALVDLKRQVWETAKASGVESADHLAHDFASRMDGLVLADASADELAAYLALLQHEASLREAS